MALKDSNGNSEGPHFSFSSEQLSNALRFAGVVCVGVLTLFLLVHTMGAVRVYPTLGEGEVAGEAQHTITVNGEADMDVLPDITTFSVSVEADGKTVAEAQSKAAAISNKAIAFIKGKGVAEKDIKTTGLYTNPKYDTKYRPCAVSMDAAVKSVSSGSGSSGSVGSAVAYPTIMPPCSSESVISGYTTYQSFDVKVRNIDKEPNKTTELVAGVASFGAKASTPYSTIDKPDVYANAVRREAIMKARAQADILAKDLGVKIVRVSSFSENGNPSYPRPYAVGNMMESKASYDTVAPELPTGTNKITSSVSITYQIR